MRINITIIQAMTVLLSSSDAIAGINKYLA